MVHYIISKTIIRLQQLQHKNVVADVDNIYIDIFIPPQLFIVANDLYIKCGK